MHQSSHRHLFLVCLWVVLISLARMDASGPPGSVALQELVDGLTTQLGIDSVVSAAIVPSNSLLVSVLPVDGDPGTFRIDVRGAVSGFPGPGRAEGDCRPRARPCLIFTHHPYLQTERLANTVAMRAVTRASLERVYSKVWAHQGTKGDLARFLGPE